MLVERLFPVFACFISIFWLLLYTVIFQAVCIANSIRRWRSCLSQETDLSPGQNNKDNISHLQVKVRQFQLFMKSGGFEALDFSAMVQVHSEYNSIGHPTLTLWDLGPRRTNGSMKPLLSAVPWAIKLFFSELEVLWTRTYETVTGQLVHIIGQTHSLS